MVNIMIIFKKAFRGILGFSLAVILKTLTNGPGQAFRILSTTLKAYDYKESRKMMLGDLVRAFSAEDDIEIHANHWMDGSTEALERFVMAILIKHFRPQLIVEIGTFRGTSTRLILDNMDASAKVFTVDLPVKVRSADTAAFTDNRLIKHRVVGTDYLNHSLAGNVSQIIGNTLDPATWEKIPEGIEFAFIDASHSYEADSNCPKISISAQKINIDRKLAFGYK